MGLPKLEHLPHYTYEDYKIWEGRWEVIYGIPYAMSPGPDIYHQQLLGNILYLTGLEIKNCPFVEHIMPIDWKITEDTIVQPDISVLIHNQEKGDYITKAPAIVIEILSQLTAEKDQNLKYDLYESNGVKYYVLVHPQKKSVEIFQLFDGKYEKVKETSEDVFEFDLQHEADCNFSLNFKEIW